MGEAQPPPSAEYPPRLPAPPSNSWRTRARHPLGPLDTRPNVEAAAAAAVPARGGIDLSSDDPTCVSTRSSATCAQSKADPLGGGQHKANIKSGSISKGGRGSGSEEQPTTTPYHADSTDFNFPPQSMDSVDIDMGVDMGVDIDGLGPPRDERGAGGLDGNSRVRGFHDMICLGFVVSLCLNLGSMTARQEGFFAAEVKCLPEGAALTVLPDLGIWVGWRQAVANSVPAVVLNLEDLSLVGAAMGILTVVGHATDCLLNAVGLAVLLYGRRKPLQEAQCRLVKRLCLASLSMAGWLLGMTIIGFLVAVVGPIGAAAVDFYSDRDLDCEDSVSVSVDYAYAMTALTILCQFFIGIVALPTPSMSRGGRGGRGGSGGSGDQRRSCCRPVSPAGCCFFFLLSCRGRGCCRCCGSPAPSPSRHEPSPSLRPPDAAQAAGAVTAWEASEAMSGRARGRGRGRGTPKSGGVEAGVDDGEAAAAAAVVATAAASTTAVGCCHPV